MLSSLPHVAPPSKLISTLPPDGPKLVPPLNAITISNVTISSAGNHRDSEYSNSDGSLFNLVTVGVILDIETFEVKSNFGKMLDTALCPALSSQYTPYFNPCVVNSIIYSPATAGGSVLSSPVILAGSPFNSLSISISDLVYGYEYTFIEVCLTPEPLGSENLNLHVAFSLAHVLIKSVSTLFTINLCVKTGAFKSIRMS